MGLKDLNFQGVIFSKEFRNIGKSERRSDKKIPRFLDSLDLKISVEYI